MRYIAAFADVADITGVRSAYPMMRAAEVLSYLEGQDAVIDEASMLESFETFKGMARNG